MMTETVLVKQSGVESGFDRVYYRPVDRKDRRLFCFQSGEKYICSQDGEPSHFTDIKLQVQHEKT